MPVKRRFVQCINAAPVMSLKTAHENHPGTSIHQSLIVLLTY